MKKPKGFTLNELMIALSVLSVVGIGVYFFTVDVSRLLIISEQKNELNRRARFSMQTMDRDARRADTMILHNSFTGTFRAAGSTTINDLRVGVGGQGDLLVLGYVDYVADDPSDNFTPYERIVCYFRAPDPGGTFTPFYRLEVIINPTAYTATPKPILESFIPTTTNTATIQFGDSDGLSNGAAFHKVGANSAIISILSREGDASLVNTNIYNFTISTS